MSLFVAAGGGSRTKVGGDVHVFQEKKGGTRPFKP